MPELLVKNLYEERKKDFELTILNAEAGLEKIIETAEVHRPGLALAGFYERFANRRTQVLGETEMAFLNHKSEDDLRVIARDLFSRDIPLIIIAKGITPPPAFLEEADRTKTAVLSSRLTTSEVTNRLSAFLDNYFAPTISVHGTLVDVYGVGLLYTGKSAIGKSEIALDLVERGHRLVADDVVKVTRRASDVIVGGASELLGQHMEIRGVGIIDVEALFGIRAIRLQKRIEVEVRLTLWSETASYERLGIDESYTQILGAEIPIVNIPISPGKNITVISEVIAMNHMLKVYGESSAEEFSRRLSERLTRQTLTRDYLESDYE
ncbi:MAG: HPr(Ser) kinase/phosphatase [candidate division Zixibacteria bacterium]|nr:HPr(Ser) kinase/phosphatase [candidate division Zixibacteria bacterium]